MDSWITPDEVKRRLSVDLPPGWSVVTKRWRGDRYVTLKNQHSASIFRLRIFNGSEHKLAKKGMCLEHSLERFLNG